MPVLTRTQPPEADHPTPAAKEKRAGTTLMEYLMMISLIIVVCLIGVGFLGGTNNGNMTSSANSISKAMKRGS